MFLTAIISKIQESNLCEFDCVNLFLINHLAKTNFNSKFPYLEVWLTDRKFKPLEIKYKIKITLVIN